jgi:hypothetical protein
MPFQSQDGSALRALLSRKMTRHFIPFSFPPPSFTTDCRSAVLSREKQIATSYPSFFYLLRLRQADVLPPSIESCRPLLDTTSYLSAHTFPLAPSLLYSKFRFLRLILCQPSPRQRAAPPSNEECTKFCGDNNMDVGMVLSFVLGVP